MIIEVIIIIITLARRIRFLNVKYFGRIRRIVSIVFGLVYYNIDVSLRLQL